MEIKLEQSWKKALSAEFNKTYFFDLVAFVKSEYTSKKGHIFPKGDQIFRALNACPLSNVKVVILGQDPYPTSGDATGLAFSVNRDANLPKSLQNLFKELFSDLGISRNQGNLDDWQAQGVFLINRVLTVPIGISNGHRNIGWEIFTEKMIKYLAESGAVGLLLGKSAQELSPYFKKKVLAPHPSPLSAHRGFFGSKIFSAVNELLDEPIKW